MHREQVATDELRKIVDDLKETGLPEEIALSEEVFKELSDAQMIILKDLHSISEEESKLDEEKEVVEGSDMWNVRLKLRAKQQQAVLAGMISLGIIQRHVFNYGALPAPEENWKYFRMPDGCFACWECGVDILVKNVSCSVHFKEFGRAMAGGGEVRNKQVVYCPNCDPTPSDKDIITESMFEDIKTDADILKNAL